jgi:hypothetical protein
MSDITKEKPIPEKSETEDDESEQEEDIEDLEEEKKLQFEEKLKNITGIGKKTAEDILNLYKTEENLKKAIKEKSLPLRDDIEKKLKKVFK